MSPAGPSSFEMLRQLAVFGERRQQVLAENVANIDTPNYKTRDLDTEGFRAALREAVLASTSPGHAGGAKAVTYKEYPGVEHLVVVREALPDAFAVFDAAAGK